MHLSFTGYEAPVDTFQHGTWDKEAFFIEAVISAHEVGNWVGDLDILSTFEDDASWLQDSSLPKVCEHTPHQKTDVSEIGQLKSIGR